MANDAKVSASTAHKRVGEAFEACAMLLQCTQRTEP